LNQFSYTHEGSLGRKGANRAFPPGIFKKEITIEEEKEIYQIIIIIIEKKIKLYPE
jgi:hypothetical protein